MLDMLKDWFDQVRKARTFPIIIIYILLITLLGHRLFVLQIVNGEKISSESEKRKDKKRYIKGTRGNIYDCNGVLLAYNELAYSVTIEDSDEIKTNKEKNEMIAKLLKILKKNNCDVDIDFEIELDKNGNFQFNVEDKALLNFKRDVYSKKSTSDLTKEQKNATAKEVFDFLRKNTGKDSPKFDISDEYSDEEALAIMSIRYEIFLNRYKKFLPITVASNIDEKTRVAIKENSSELPGVEVSTDTHRKYNDSKYFSHVVGYTGTVNENELSDLKKSGLEEKYTSEDQVGKTGVEKEYEKYLHGARGLEKLTVNQSGRILSVSNMKAASSGNDIYLTIDSKLQKACYDMLEKELASILLSKIHRGKGSGTKGSRSDGITIPEYDVYYALVNNNIIDITILNDKDASITEKRVYTKYSSKRDSVLNKLKSILAANSTVTAKDLSEEYQVYQIYLYNYLCKKGIILDDKVDSDDTKYKTYTADGKINKKFSLSVFMQDAIANGWADLSCLDIGNKYYSTTELYNKLIDYVYKEIKDDKGFAKKIYYYLIDNGSVSGNDLCVILYDQGVLSYNKNEIVNLKNGTTSAYTFLRKQIQNLKITPAMLALEPCSGSIVVTDPDTGNVKACVSYPGYDTNKFANKMDTDYYYKTYEDLSLPTLNRVVTQRTAPGSTYKPLVSIAALTEGIITTGTKITDRVVFSEISEKPKCWSNYSHGTINVSKAIEYSCNYFFYTVGYNMSDKATHDNKGIKTLAKYAKMFGFDATSGLSSAEYKPIISDNSAVMSAIGQGKNDYTPSQIARYATTLVNQKKCYDLNLVSQVKNNKGKTIKKQKAKVHHNISIASTTWDAVYKGMYGVVNGSQSSIVQYFKSLKDDGIQVAGKTGTAQESKSKPNHALFISFAPFKNPEICTTVVIPNGYTSANAAEVASNIYKYYFAKGKKAKQKVVKQASSLKKDTTVVAGD